MSPERKSTKTTYKRLFVFCCVLLVAVAVIVPIYRAHRVPEADELVQQLSWDSVGCDCNGVFLVIFPDGPPAKRLMRIGRPASTALLRVLDDPTRGVAAHPILTQIYHPDRVGTSTEYHRDEKRLNKLVGSDIVGWTYSVNGLKWQWHSDGDRQTVDPADLNQNSKRWRAEL